MAVTARRFDYNSLATMINIVVILLSTNLTILCRADNDANSEQPLNNNNNNNNGAWRNGWNLLEADKSPVWRDPPAILLPRRGANNPKPDLEQLRPKTKRIIFNKRYMSETEPSKRELTRRNGTMKARPETPSRKKLMSSMPSDLKTLHFPVPGSDRELGVRASKKLRLWLWNMALCPVLPLWKDYGPTRWPRYINVGQCSQKRSCSYPKGMRCKPSMVKKLDTFYWYCSERPTLSGKRCMWVRYEEIVVEKCECGC